MPRVDGRAPHQLRPVALTRDYLIHPEGAPPFMIRGFWAERELLDQWEEQYGIPVITSGTTQEQPGGMVHPGGIMDGLCVHKVERDHAEGHGAKGRGYADFRERAFHALG